MDELSDMLQTVDMKTLFSEIGPKEYDKWHLKFLGLKLIWKFIITYLCPVHGPYVDSIPYSTFMDHWQQNYDFACTLFPVAARVHPPPLYSTVLSSVTALSQSNRFVPFQ